MPRADVLRPGSIDAICRQQHHVYSKQFGVVRCVSYSMFSERDRLVSVSQCCCKGFVHA